MKGAAPIRAPGLRPRRAFRDMEAETRDLCAALEAIRNALEPMTDETLNAFASIETFCDVALRLMAKTNPSKLRDVARTVEIRARMDGVQFISMHEERAP